MISLCTSERFTHHQVFPALAENPQNIIREQSLVHFIIVIVIYARVGKAIIIFAALQPAIIRFSRFANRINRQ
jgi:hypothetical protein